MVRRLLAIAIAFVLAMPATTRLHAVQDGVVEMQVGQGFNGALLGAAIGVATRDFILGVPSALLLMGGGIYAPRKFADSNIVTPATARFTNFMSVWGAGAGLTFSMMTGSNDRGMAGYIFLFDLTATIAGYAYVNKQGTPTPGETGQIISGAMYGTGFAWLVLANPLAAKDLTDVDEGPAGLALFLGQSAGLGFGFWLANEYNWSRQKALAVDLSIVGGFAFGYGLGVLFNMPYAMRYSLGVVALAAALVATLQLTSDWQQEERSVQPGGETQANIALPPMRFGF